ADAVAPVADGAGRDPAASLGGVELGEEFPQGWVCHAYLLADRVVANACARRYPITWTHSMQMVVSAVVRKPWPAGEWNRAVGCLLTWGNTTRVLFYQVCTRRVTIEANPVSRGVRDFSPLRRCLPAP